MKRVNNVQMILLVMLRGQQKDLGSEIKCGPGVCRLNLRLTRSCEDSMKTKVISCSRRGR